MDKQRCVNCKWYCYGYWCFKFDCDCSKTWVCDEWEAC